MSCPTPGKRLYKSRKEARHAKHAKGGLLRPYLCACGWYHLGHLGSEVVAGIKSRAQAYGRGA